MWQLAINANTIMGVNTQAHKLMGLHLVLDTVIGAHTLFLVGPAISSIFSQLRLIVVQTQEYLLLLLVTLIILHGTLILVSTSYSWRLNVSLELPG